MKARKKEVFSIILNKKGRALESKVDTGAYPYLVFDKKKGEFTDVNREKF